MKKIGVLLLMLGLIGAVGFYVHHLQHKLGVLEEQKSDLKVKELLRQKKIEKAKGKNKGKRKPIKALPVRPKNDKDADGIPDDLDISPNGKGRNIVKYLKWNFSTTWKWEVAIPSDVVHYYEKVKRPQWIGNANYYAWFVHQSDIGLQDLSEGLKEIIKTDGKKYKWRPKDEVMFVARMVQSLHYVDDKLTGFDDYTKFPMQTINDGTGDCEDMAILTAALLKKIGYDVALVYIDPPKSKVAHLGVGVAGVPVRGMNYWYSNLKKYYYLETTGTEWKIGELPEEWKGKDVKVQVIKL